MANRQQEDAYKIVHKERLLMTQQENVKSTVIRQQSFIKTHLQIDVFKHALQHQIYTMIHSR